MSTGVRHLVNPARRWALAPALILALAFVVAGLLSMVPGALLLASADSVLKWLEAPKK